MSDWAKERANAMQSYHGNTLVLKSDVVAALNEAEQRVIARLRDPDKSLIEALTAELKWQGTDAYKLGICRALAAFLSSPPQEG